MGTVENVFDNGVTVLKIGMNSDFNLTLAYWAFVALITLTALVTHSTFWSSTCTDTTLAMISLQVIAIVYVVSSAVIQSIGGKSSNVP